MKNKYLYSITFLIFLSLSLLIVWPLLPYLNTNVYHLNSDPSIFIWNIEHIKNAVINFKNPFFTDNLFYPIGDNLIFHTYAFFWGIIAIPFLSFLDIITVYNSIGILTYALGGFCMFLLAYRITKNYTAALLSGLYFGFNPYVTSHRDHLSLLSTFVFPLFFYFYWEIKSKLPKELSIKQLLPCSLVLLMTFLIDFQYLIFILILLLLINILSRKFALWKSQSIITDIKILIYFTISALPFIILYLVSFKNLESIKVPLWEYDLWSADIVGFFIPSTFNGFLGQKVISSFGNLGEQLYIGWTAIILLITQMFLLKKKDDDENKHKKILKIFYICLLVFFIISLGPHLKLFKDITKFPLPHYLLTYIPFLNSIRCIGRIFILGYFSIAIILGIFFAYIIKTTKSKYIKLIILFIITTLIIIEFSTAPLSNSSKGDSTATPKVFTELSQTKDDYAILQIPLGWSSGRWILGNRPMIFNYYAMRSGKKDVGGMLARVSQDVEYYFTNDLFFKTMMSLGLEADDNAKIQDTITSEIKMIIDNLKKYKIKYIIIHESLISEENKNKIFSLFANSDKFEFKAYPEDQITLITLLDF